MTGESPIIDTTATRVVQNFKLEQLQSLPNGRDMWSLLAVTPGVQMSRIDVGGNPAGTQTDYRANGIFGYVDWYNNSLQGSNIPDGELTGDGKTVLKGNYGLYWHNPGVGTSSNANPNTSGKSATYDWVDVNGDKRWQLGRRRFWRRSRPGLGCDSSGKVPLVG